MARPGAFINTVGDTSLLPHVLAAAARFETAPAAGAIDELIDRRSLAPLFV